MKKNLLTILLSLLFLNLSLIVIADKKDYTLFVSYFVKYDVDVKKIAPAIYTQALKVYPEMSLVGKIIIDNELKLYCLFDDEETIKAIESIYNDGLKEGFTIELLYKDKPDKYPKNGKLYRLHKGWSWYGTVLKDDEYFVEAFLEILYRYGYLELEKSVGEEFFKSKTINDSNKYKLLNATKLKRGDSIYVYDRTRNIYIYIKHEPYLDTDFIPEYL